MLGFLSTFEIMLSCICIFLSCLHAYASFFLLSYGCLFLFGYFSILFYFVFHIIFFKKNQKNTKTVCVLCTLVLVYLGWSLNFFFSNLCISCNLDEHLYAQLSKWALWLLFVMSKIKQSLVLNTRITFFCGND